MRGYRFDLHKAFVGLVIRLRNDGTFEKIESKDEDKHTDEEIKDILDPEFKQLLDILGLIDESDPNNCTIVSLDMKSAFRCRAKDYIDEQQDTTFKNNILAFMS